MRAERISCLRRLSAKVTPLHGHRLRTPPTDELTTILQLFVQQICHIAIARAQHLDVSRCWDVANCCPLAVLYNMSVARVRVVEFGTKYMQASMGHERLSALTLMYIRHNVTVDATTVVDAFMKRQPRRLELLHWTLQCVCLCFLNYLNAVVKGTV